MAKWKRWILPALCAALALGLAGAVTWGVMENRDKNQYIRQIQARYNSAFDQMSSGMAGLENKLSKLLIASGTSKGQTTLLLMDVCRDVSGAEHMLSELPVSQAATAGLVKFVNQTGDYCTMLARKISLGGAMESGDAAQLSALTDECRKLSAELENIRAGGGMQWELARNEYLALSADGPHTAGKLEKAAEDMPTLLYDGPFSDSRDNRQPRQAPANDVSPEAARAIALEALQSPGASLACSGEMDGTLPCWVLTGALADGRSADASVTKKGGRILMMRITAPVSSGAALPDEGTMDTLGKKAAAYLATIGYTDMTPCFAQVNDGTAVVNCVCVQDDVLIYPDMVKVWMDVQSGQPAGLEARQYLMNHTARSLPAPGITQDQAIGELGTRMQIDSVRLSVIPTPDMKEKLCYEVTGFRGSETYMVYIDAQTGVEEQIYRILDTDEGKLAM